jgi:uncharacterized OB-fold protein
MTKPIQHPRPFVDWETRAYWEAAGRQELVLQRCGACGQVQHRPRALCAGCLSDRIEWFRASGRGTVHTYTVTHQNQAPGFREATPYVLAYVELEEGVRILTNVVGCEPEQIRIGMPVRVEFAAAADDIAIPRFRPE